MRRRSGRRKAGEPGMRRDAAGLPQSIAQLGRLRQRPDAPGLFEQFHGLDEIGPNLVDVGDQFRRGSFTLLCPWAGPAAKIGAGVLHV